MPPPEPANTDYETRAGAFLKNMRELQTKYEIRAQPTLIQSKEGVYTTVLSLKDTKPLPTSVEIPIEQKLPPRKRTKSK